MEEAWAPFLLNIASGGDDMCVYIARLCVYVCACAHVYMCVQVVYAWGYMYEVCVCLCMQVLDW